VEGELSFIGTLFYEIFDGSWLNAIVISDHGIGFACARLTVGQNGPVVAVTDRFYDAPGYVLENLLLGRVLLKNSVEVEVSLLEISFY
jgi:hypothetical protein